MKKLLLVLLVSLTGCTYSEQYKMYADSQAQLETARYNAEAAKYKAMSDIASSGSESSKVAAVMAIALGQQGTSAQRSTLQPPQQSEALQWAQILVPGVVQTMGIIANRQIAISQSENAAAVAVSTNSTFLGMSGKIQAPAANVSSVTIDNHTQTMSGTGVLGSGTYTTTANPTTTTLSGSGTIGSGAYSTIDSHAVSTTTDNHSVTSPVPVFAPIITSPVVTPPVFSPFPVVAVP